jgi:hypothetical protein
VDGAPDARWLWNAAGPGPAAGLVAAVNLARTDRTDQLGRMLAPAGVLYVALVTSLAPEITGEQSPEVYPVPPDLAPALAHQLDLTPVVSGTGITVYANAASIPLRAEVVAGKSAVASGAGTGMLTGLPGSPIVPRAVPVLPGPAASRSFTGPVSAGTVLAALAPAGRWSLTTHTGQASRSPSFGWAARYQVTAPGISTLHFDGGVVAPAALLFSIVVWLAAVVFLLGGRLGGPWQRVRIHRRRTGAGGRDGDAGPPAQDFDAGGAAWQARL